MKKKIKELNEEEKRVICRKFKENNTSSLYRGCPLYMNYFIPCVRDIETKEIEKFLNKEIDLWKV